MALYLDPRPLTPLLEPLALRNGTHDLTYVYRTVVSTAPHIEQQTVTLTEGKLISVLQ